MIPLSVPSLKGNELKYLKECIKTEYVSSVGKYVGLFEKKVCNYTGSKYAVACSSGTSAIQLALRTVGVRENDEVIIPTLTFIATANAPRYLKAIPIFMDCDRFYNLDTKKLVTFVENNTYLKNGYSFNKKTNRRISAILPVHVSGNAVDLSKIIKLCKKRKIKIVEDAAESFGTFYNKGNLKNKHTGTVGDVGCLSFNGNKIITSGGGGMILTNNKKIADFARYLSTQATDDSINYVHHNIGYNFRLTNIQAAVGLAQLEKIKHFLGRKKQIYNFYKKELKNIKNVSFVLEPDHAKNNHWMMSILLKKNSHKMRLIKFLKEKNIQTRSIWLPCHMQKQYKKYEKYKISNAEKFFKKTINIPCSTNLNIGSAKKVVKSIAMFF